MYFVRIICLIVGMAPLNLHTAGSYFFIKYKCEVSTSDSALVNGGLVFFQGVGRKVKDSIVLLTLFVFVAFFFSFCLPLVDRFISITLIVYHCTIR